MRLRNDLGLIHPAEVHLQPGTENPHLPGWAEPEGLMMIIALAIGHYENTNTMVTMCGQPLICRNNTDMGG